MSNQSKLGRLSGWATAGRRAISTSPQVKVYGILRSGTNYLSALLEANFRVHSLDSTEKGWKHGPIQVHPEVRSVLIVRDPYTWITSFYDWERIHNRTEAQLSEFISSPVTHRRLRECWNVSDPIDAWNTAYSSWLASADERDLVVIRYEDLLSDFGVELRRVEDRYHLRRRKPELEDITDRVDTWRTPNPRPEFIRGAGSSNRIPLAPEVLRLVTERLDREVMAELGYDLRS